MKTSITLLLSGLAAQQASATWNRNSGHFNSPQYNNNECSDKQKGGFNWGDISTGPINNYGDFNFPGGWTCENRFGKRDSLTKRTFNSRCIKNKVKKDTPAAFDCSARKDGFSVKEIQVSVEYDCDLEFHYKMPDNSVCKHTAPCKKEGTTVQNTQCGGAQSVEVYLGNHNQEDRDDCEIGFHHIDFDCNPGYTPTPKSSQPVYTPSETPSQPVYTPSETPSQPVYTPSETPSKPTETPSETSSQPVYTPETSSQPGYTPPAETSETPSQSIYTPPGETPSETPSHPIYTPPAESTTPPPPVYGNSTVPTETPGYTPPPAPEYSASSPSETPGYTPSQGTSAPPQSSSQPEHPGYTPPECLPKCMNTWLEINTKCKDNTDSTCYCKNPDFTKSVIECVAAWSTDEETKQALQYLIGICASYVPENPGIITNCPSNIPLNPTPPATPAETTAAPYTTAPPAGPPAGPVTTITYQTTVTVPCSCGVPESSTVSTISTCVTVPQVVFTTQTPAQPPAPGVTVSEPVNLVPGTAPPAVPAVTTIPPYPIPSGATPSGFGTVAVPSGSLTATSPAQFTGAASPVRANFAPALFGAALAFFAL